jgi:hypothetical protein
MDSRKTTQEDEDRRGTENVVRLPRDWLGPREELVPIGSRARAVDASDQDPTEAILPNAASFWGEDSGSLQSPMQPPADAWPPAPTERQVPPPRTRRRISRPRFEWAAGGAFISRRRATAAIAVLAAGVLLVLALTGRTEGGTHNASDKTASLSKNSPIETGTGANRARLKAKTPVVTQIHAQPQSHRSARARHHAGRSRAHKPRIHATTIHRRHRPHPTPRPTNSTSEPVRTTTPTYTPAPASSPTTSPPATTSAPSSPPASTDRSTRSSSQHQPAFGASGSLGPGSSPDS